VFTQHHSDGRIAVADTCHCSQVHHHWVQQKDLLDMQFTFGLDSVFTISSLLLQRIRVVWQKKYGHGKIKKRPIFSSMLKDPAPNIAFVVAHRRPIRLLGSWSKEYRLIEDCLGEERTKHIWRHECYDFGFSETRLPPS